MNPQQPPPPPIDRPTYPTHDRKALNSWAHDFGYADFDTYIRAGGSILEARKEIAMRISYLESALRSLDTHIPASAQTQPGAAAQASPEPAELPDPSELDEPDPHNAHPQGHDA